MAGHNKWSKIKHKKAITDARKSKIFTKIVRLIQIEAKKSGGDKNAPGLRLALEKAREVNMPSENIERAIKKATDPSEQLESITYEAYAPGGVALIIEVLTNNKNRSTQEIKHILSKNNSALGTIGSAVWAFEKTNDGWNPTTCTPVSETDGELLETLIDALEENDDVQDVFTNASDE